MSRECRSKLQQDRAMIQCKKVNLIVLECKFIVFVVDFGQVLIISIGGSV